MAEKHRTFLFDKQVFLYILLTCTVCPETGPYPQYGWDFPAEVPEKIRKDPGNALRAFFCSLAASGHWCIAKGSHGGDTNLPHSHLKAFR